MNPLIVAGVLVRAYEGGLFCINDFHKAAGAQKKDQPSNFFDTKSTQEMVSVLLDEKPGVEQNQVLKTINGGNQQGTYVCKELVYSYAMWVSPVFALRVIRAFDDMANQKLSPTVPLEKYNNLLGDYVNLQTKHIGLQDQLLSLPKPNVLKTGRYSPDEDAIILEKRAQGCGARTLGRILNRTQDSVAHRLRYLNLKIPPLIWPTGENADIFRAESWQKAEYVGSPFSVKEDRFIIDQLKKGHAIADIANIMDRTIRAVANRVAFIEQQLGVSFAKEGV